MTSTKRLTRKLKLRFQEEMIQGKFSLKGLNFLLVFQVNCPGCLIYALPLMNRIHQDQRLSHISLLALSTAFEDFEFNTREHTEALVHSNDLVGASKEMFQSNGYDKLPYSIDFPVAMDNVITSDKDFIEMAAELSGTEVFQSVDSEQITQYLRQIQSVHYTFAANAMQGTPTFVLFNDSYTILSTWFGHRNPESVIELLLSHSEV